MTTTTTTNPPTGRSAFFYGTLMAPQVLHRVCYGILSKDNPVYTASNLITQPALLHNYRRHRVKNADYPAIMPHPDSSVRGTYVTGLTDADIFRLDIFEGGDYSLEKVKCQLLTGTGDEIVDAETYVWTAGAEELEDREWDFDEFKKEKMQFWVGAEGDGRSDYTGRASIIEVDEAVAAAEGRDGTGGRGANGHITNALKEAQAKPAQ